MKPLLIVVTGRPGAGKSTLARALGEETRLPVVSRDRLKEGWERTARLHGEALPENANLPATNRFFETLAFLLEREISCVAEAAFQHKLWSARLEPLRPLADIRLVVCRVGAALARRRFLERAERDSDFTRVHGGEPPVGGYEEPRLELPTLYVDTSDGYSPSLESLCEKLLPKG